MMYEELVKDFARRTLDNLVFIERHIDGSDTALPPFEVTQLINSLLGLVVFPKESLKDIPDTSLNELKSNGWLLPEIHPEAKCTNLNDLVSNFRHAIAHFNIKFIPNEKGEIVGIEAENKGRKVKLKFSIDELRDFTRRFAELIISEQL